MNELKISREAENQNESKEIKELCKTLNVETEGLKLGRPKADKLVTKRIDLLRPAVRQKEVAAKDDVNAKEIDKKYLETLKHDLKECNPNFKLGRKWQINCQRCVPTFEMRRRGYDVTAKPREKGFDLLSCRPFDVWKNPEVINTRGNGLSDIEKHMSRWGDGARAQVVVMWKGAPSGHTFFAERVNGQTRFYDPQTGSSDVSNYFKRVEPGSLRFCRVDNLEPGEKINDCFRRV